MSDALLLLLATTQEQAVAPLIFDVAATGQNDDYRCGTGANTPNPITSWTPTIEFDEWVSIARGQNFGAAINSSGEAFAWGVNTDGQCGQGNTTSPVTDPSQIGAATNWRRCCLGTTRTWLINDAFDIFACGNNDNSRLGIGAATNPVTTLTEVGAGIDWQSLRSGSFWTVLQNTDGALYWFGVGSAALSGRGDGTTTSADAPVVAASGAVAALDKFAVGAVYCMFIEADGTLWGWGQNASGQQGRGNTTSPHDTAAQIGADTDWAEVACGDEHTLAIKTDGTLWACGLNTSGQLGRGDTTSPQTTFVQIGTATNWVAIECIAATSYAINDEGELWAWGLNTSGELGRGNTTSPQTSPVLVQTGVSVIASGSSLALHQFIGA